MGVSQTNMKRYSIYATCTDCKMHCCLSLKCNLNISLVRASVSLIHPLLVLSRSVWVFPALLPGWWCFRRQDVRWSSPAPRFSHFIVFTWDLQLKHSLHLGQVVLLFLGGFSPFSDDWFVRFSDAPLAATPPIKASGLFKLASHSTHFSTTPSYHSPASPGVVCVWGVMRSDPGRQTSNMYFLLP